MNERVRPLINGNRRRRLDKLICEIIDGLLASV